MKITQYIAAITLALSAVSCSDYLTVLPENNQSQDQFWNTKEEVSAVLGAGYVKLRECNENLFLWGEARGNGITLGIDGTAGQKDAKKLRSMDIVSSNSLASWANLYKTIGMANSVIKYGPGVVEKDASFNINVCNSYLSEAYFLRALSYFYLVRTWNNVPYISEPYVDDSQQYQVPQQEGSAVLKNCLADLTKALESAKDFFPETNPAYPMNTKGRATKWAIYSLIADINLWLGNYNECITACTQVENSGRVGLISGNNWFTNFYPGNSNESLFEIQYNYALGQTNSFISWFSTNSNYTISAYTSLLFAATSPQGDVRALNASYNTTGQIWKYIGTSASIARSSSGQNDQNFIVYRLADIYLMHAEANIMLGDSAHFANAKTLIDLVRKRANITPSAGGSDKLTLMRQLLEERQREFFAEGKNWFDLVRTGLREVQDPSNTGFKNLMIEHVLQVASPSTQAMIRSKLTDPNSWYLPVSTTEMNANSLLKQNPFYENLGN